MSIVRRSVLVALPLLLAVLWPLRMLWTVTHTGTDAILGFDYLAPRYVPVVAAIRAGHYHWSHLISDSTIFGTHVVTAPFLLRVALAQLTDWSMRAELVAGVVMVTLGVLLFWRAFSWPYRHSPLRWWLLALMSGVLFSNAAINDFTWGEIALNAGLECLGLGIAVHAAVTGSKAWWQLTRIIAGCVLCSFSGGVGPLSWAVAGTAYLASPRRTRRGVAVLLVAAVACAIVIGLHLDPAEHPSEKTPGVGTAVGLMLPALGWSVTPTFSHTHAGIIGAGMLVLLVLAALALWRGPRGVRREMVPATAVAVFGLATIASIIASRARLTPWYPTLFAPLWTGTLGMLYVAWNARERRGTLLRWGAGVVVAAVLAVVAVSDRSYEGRVLYLKLRSPVAASCLRHYRTDLPICWKAMWMPNVWADEPYSTSIKRIEPLETAGLSVFGTHQTWWLQGDWFLPGVQAHGDGTPQWVLHGTSQKRAVTDWHQLDLLLPKNGVVEWTTGLADNTTYAHLKGVVSARHDTATLRIDMPGPDTIIHVGSSGKKLDVRIPTDTRKVTLYSDRPLRLSATRIELHRHDHHRRVDGVWGGVISPDDEFTSAGPDQHLTGSAHIWSLPRPACLDDISTISVGGEPAKPPARAQMILQFLDSSGRPATRKLPVAVDPRQAPDYVNWIADLKTLAHPRGLRISAVAASVVPNERDDFFLWDPHLDLKRHAQARRACDTHTNAAS